MLASRQVTMNQSVVPDNCVITLSAADASNTFKQVNIHKAARPDRLPGHVLRACADHRAGVFTDIFNMSLIESVIPTCFKQTTIPPVPKHTKATCLNDYRPVALTSVAMKCFERVVMTGINTIIPKTLGYSNLHTAQTYPQMMLSLLHSTLPFPTWTKGTLT